jgi:Cys-rich repeat protein
MRFPATRRDLFAGVIGGLLTAWPFARVDARAAGKKKHRKRKRKCERGTTRCGKSACCRAGQTCVSGQCVDAPIIPPACLSDAQCALGEICQDNVCVDGTIVAPECLANDQCAPGEICQNEVRVDGGTQAECQNANQGRCARLCPTLVGP